MLDTTLTVSFWFSYNDWTLALRPLSREPHSPPADLTQAYSCSTTCMQWSQITNSAWTLPPSLRFNMFDCLFNISYWLAIGYLKLSPFCSPLKTNRIHLLLYVPSKHSQGPPLLATPTSTSCLHFQNGSQSIEVNPTTHTHTYIRTPSDLSLCIPNLDAVK